MSSLKHPTTDIATASQKAGLSTIMLIQSRRLLKCGTVALRIDLSISNCYHSYSIGVNPGFEGGGRDADMCLAPRLRVSDSTPKMMDTTGELVDVFPALDAIERRVDGRPYSDTHLPEGKTPQRLERAMQAVEPLLRQLVNQRQKQLDKQQPVVGDQPLIARIKSILSSF